MYLTLNTKDFRGFVRTEGGWEREGRVLWPHLYVSMCFTNIKAVSRSESESSESSSQRLRDRPKIRYISLKIPLFRVHVPSCGSRYQPTSLLPTAQDGTVPTALFQAEGKLLRVSPAPGQLLTRCVKAENWPGAQGPPRAVCRNNDNVCLVPSTGVVTMITSQFRCTRYTWKYTRTHTHIQLCRNLMWTASHSNYI